MNPPSLTIGIEEEYQIIDPHTVRFITEKPWPGLIDRISLGDVLMMPPKALKADGAKGLLAKPAGVYFVDDATNTFNLLH